MVVSVEFDLELKDKAMNILISGGTGFVGRYLIPALLKEWYKITVIGRHLEKIETAFKNSVTAVTWERLSTLDPNQFDVIINLSGQNIGEKRWTSHIKQLIKDSRVRTTNELAKWANGVNKPLRFFNASAIGIYGIGNENYSSTRQLDESTPINWRNPTDFLSEVGQSWEQATTSITNPKVSIIWMRFAPILKRNEGLLKQMVPIFQLGLGGPLGTGNQPFSWIYIDDLINAILFLLAHPEYDGVFNLVAPECVPQKTFAKTLATVMHRPAFIKMPASVLRFAFGQMANELLLSGQCVYPKRLLDAGFTFHYPTLATALANDWQGHHS